MLMLPIMLLPFVLLFFIPKLVGYGMTNALDKHYNLSAKIPIFNPNQTYLKL